MHLSVLPLLVLAGMVALSGCELGSPTNLNCNPITIEPQSVSLSPGQSQKFVAYGGDSTGSLGFRFDRPQFVEMTLNSSYSVTLTARPGFSGYYGYLYASNCDMEARSLVQLQ